MTENRQMKKAVFRHDQYNGITGLMIRGKETGTCWCCKFQLLIPAWLVITFLSSLQIPLFRPLSVGNYVLLPRNIRKLTSHHQCLLRT